MKIRALLASVMLPFLFAAAMAQSFSEKPAVLVLIPEGFPVTLSVEVEDLGGGDMRCNLQPKVMRPGSRITGIEITDLMVDAEGRLLHSGNGTMREDAKRGIRLEDAARGEIAWDRRYLDVHQLILVVVRVETEAGAWVLSGRDQRPDRDAIVARGAAALPRGKFVPRP